MKKLLLLGLSTFAISAHAWEPSYYAGAGFSPWKVNSQAISLDYSVQTIDGFVGINLFPHISLEARVGGGINEGRDSYYYLDGGDIMELRTGTEITYYASAYFRPYIANERASLYGLLGVTTIELDTNSPGMTSEDTENAASFGIGVSFSMTPNIDVVAEWKKLINADEFDIRGGTIGFAYKF
jgi:opacity protein-like surface antigen